MKKLITAIAFFVSIGANAQTYDTTSLKPYAVIKLQVPFSPTWNDTSKATLLHVVSTSDNFKDGATFHWVLFSAAGKPLVGGDINISGLDYKSWSGDNLFPFQFVASKLGLPIK